MRRLLLIIAIAIHVSLAFSQSGSLADLAKPQQGTSRRESSTFREAKSGHYDSKAFPKGDALEKSNWDNFRVAPGQSHTLMEVDGPGVITHIWMAFLGPEPQSWASQGSANHQEMLLRVYWDGDKRPAIEAPVGDFFANAFGKRSTVVSSPVIVEDADSYNCFWHMPFRKSAKIEIVNQSSRSINLLYYNIDWIQKPVAGDTPYFYAQYRQEYPVQTGQDYVVLDTKGKGHYVGTVLSVRTRSPSWFGEGDEKISIDGEARPSIWGTGTEDYFLSAWGLQRTLTPYFGTPYFDQWGIVGGHTSAYRWHITDPIVFQNGIRVAFEHWGWISPDENAEYKSTSWNEREDDYSSVAFWYQTGRPTFAARAPTDRRLPSLDRTVAYARDGETHGIGEAVRQTLPHFEGPQVLYMPPASGIESDPKSNVHGAWMEIPLDVAQKEPLRLLIDATTSYDFGKYQVYLVPPNSNARVKIGGPLDFYSNSIAHREFHLLDFWPEPGRYKVRLECVGKNPASTGHYLGLESIRLRERRPRVKRMGHDQHKDWRSDPKLYG
jgi:hypothetical protein